MLNIEGEEYLPMNSLRESPSHNCWCSMDEKDINGCVTSSSGSEPLCSASPSDIHEPRVTVEELTMNNLHDIAFLRSLSPSTSSSLVIQNKPFLRAENTIATMPVNVVHHQLHPNVEGIPDLLGTIEKNYCSNLSNQLAVDAQQCYKGVSLREMLKPGYTRMSKVECLQLFRQIVELVDFAHSQDIVLLELRPSWFLFFPSKKVKYVGSSAKREVETVTGSGSKRQRLGFNIRPLKHMKGSSSNYGFKTRIVTDMIPHVNILPLSMSNESKAHDLDKQQFSSTMAQLEDKWYTSPDESNEIGCTIASNIYNLGVLLFELLCWFESWEAQCSAMMNLCERIMPPNFLSENPKEAGFCLRLLHPESRPTTREILQSDLFRGPFELHHGESISPSKNDAESEVLLHFLVSLKEQKLRNASKLAEEIAHIEGDLKKIQRHFFPKASPLSAMFNEARLMKNLNQLEESYFLMSSKSHFAGENSCKSTKNLDIDVLKNRERWPDQQCHGNGSNTGIRPFSNALCKFAQYSKFEVRGMLKNGDLLSSANVIRSIGFNRDEDFIATAGVSKKIKVFEFSALLDDSVDIHYPVVEMSNKSKLSCVCWNGYVRNYIASTDYDGVVQLWDVETAKGLSEYTEHHKRAWSADFSQADPTKFASGSDDCSVKLWRINERNSIGTIWNPANVCCVQFSTHSTNLLVFGCADNKIYCYDLRHTKVPWGTLMGHGKTVSYVKFLDFETLVSASTDNTLKIWDLKEVNSNGLSSNNCSSTLKGHTNEKNFVGLSVQDGYIACGSETNEVYSYYRSLPMPITCHKFEHVEVEIGNDSEHFVSSVCWGKKSNMVVAANSAGCLKVLQMV